MNSKKFHEVVEELHKKHGICVMPITMATLHNIMKLKKPEEVKEALRAVITDSISNN